MSFSKIWRCSIYEFLYIWFVHIFYEYYLFKWCVQKWVLVVQKFPLYGCSSNVFADCCNFSYHFFCTICFFHGVLLLLRSCGLIIVVYNCPDVEYFHYQHYSNWSLDHIFWWLSRVFLKFWGISEIRICMVVCKTDLILGQHQLYCVSSCCLSSDVEVYFDLLKYWNYNIL
jgi:hypothetical protein